MPPSGSFLKTRERSSMFPLNGDGVVALPGIEGKEIYLNPSNFVVFGEVSACVNLAIKICCNRVIGTNDMFSE